jgi:hypothetical protein
MAAGPMEAAESITVRVKSSLASGYHGERAQNAGDGGGKLGHNQELIGRPMVMATRAPGNDSR